MSSTALETNLGAQDRTGAYRLWIGGERWDDLAKDQQVEFQEEAGGSRLTFTAREPMQHLLGRKVFLEVGTEEGFKPLFTGRLIRPMPDPPSFTSAAVALGPFAQMAEQTFTEPVDYSSTLVRDALKDICSRAGYAQGVPVIRAVGGKRIEDLMFAEDVKLLEGASSVCESADLVQTDTSEGNRVFMPRPHPGGGNDTKTRYDGSDYKTFQVDYEYPTTYAKVAILRRSSNDAQGSYEVRAVRPVAQPYGIVPAPKNRVWYITDFAGDQREANQAAYDNARRLGIHGEIKWSMTELPLAPVRRYSSITGVREIERVDGLYRETYDLTIHDGATYRLKEWKMDLGGLGILVEEEKIARNRIYVGGAPSPAVLK